jgi:D-alanyl-lipoteichoic acid acyltransferase DltB (MBOAT superfamily)
MIANTFFYIYGGIGIFVFACVFSSVIWLLSIIVTKLKDNASFLFGIIICIALLPLLVVKYTGFAIENINNIFGSGVNIPTLVVPVGISFYTFEAVSLLCDIRNQKINEKVSLLDVYLYLMFFPTVTSGPIFRFQNFREGLTGELNLSYYGNAIDRIIIGLSKKVLVADKIGAVADYYFNGVAAGSNYSCMGLWIGSIAYTLQLYFDFSGYSDMAIGIGKLLGFDICENFNAPYQAKSISDFWKRWHISLTKWFRDYVYIPRGGIDVRCQSTFLICL